MNDTCGQRRRRRRRVAYLQVDEAKNAGGKVQLVSGSRPPEHRRVRLMRLASRALEAECAKERELIQLARSASSSAKAACGRLLFFYLFLSSISRVC